MGSAAAHSVGPAGPAVTRGRMPIPRRGFEASIRFESSGGLRRRYPRGRALGSSSVLRGPVRLSARLSRVRPPRSPTRYAQLLLDPPPPLDAQPAPRPLSAAGLRSGHTRWPAWPALSPCPHSPWPAEVSAAGAVLPEPPAESWPCCSASQHPLAPSRQPAAGFAADQAEEGWRDGGKGLAADQAEADLAPSLRASRPSAHQRGDVTSGHVSSPGDVTSGHVPGVLPSKEFQRSPRNPTLARAEGRAPSRPAKPRLCRPAPSRQHSRQPAKPHVGPEAQYWP